MKKEEELGEGETESFCEKCNLVCGEKRCPKCGSKKLRTVLSEDFCYAGRVSWFFGESLKFNLESDNIGCVLMPYGSGLNIPYEEYLVYVRYKNLTLVREILKNQDG